MQRDVLGPVVEQAATGDEVAFARIVAAYHDDLARVCFVVCRDVEMAREAAHATWPIAWRKLCTIRDPERLRPWLMSVAVNEARQLMRRRGRRSLVEIPVEPETEGRAVAVGADPAERAAEVDLANALARLSLEDRQVIGMRYAAGLSSTEIGQVVGMTSGGVRARLARLLVRLREDLRDE